MIIVSSSILELGETEPPPLAVFVEWVGLVFETPPTGLILLSFELLSLSLVGEAVLLFLADPPE